MKKYRRTHEWKEILVQDMETEHIKNCVKMLEIIFEDDEWVDEYETDYWKKIFAVELMKRWEYDFVINELL